MISSVGPPPDLHAKRVVTEMLRYLHIEYERLRARGDGIINPHEMGTPKAQERTVAQLRKAVGDMVLRRQSTARSDREGFPIFASRVAGQR
jgi:hypothetical protein